MFLGWNDLGCMRTLLRDLGLDPWRQKVVGWRKWLPWAWLDVRMSPEQYATMGEERAANRAKTHHVQWTVRDMAMAVPRLASKVDAYGPYNGLSNR